MIDELSTDIRDSRIQNLIVAFEWENDSHTVELILQKKGKPRKSYLFMGVKEIHFSEDFRAADISHCKILDQGDALYVSLDPHTEDSIMDEKDNFVIVASSVEVRTIREGQQIGDGNAVKPPGDERTQ